MLFSDLPDRVILQVTSHLRRRTLVLLSSTSEHIRLLILPLVFKTLTLYGITQSSIQKCNISLQPATLSSFEGFRVHVGFRPEDIVTPWVVDFDTKTLCALSNLLCSMRNLKTFTLKVSFPKHMPEAISMSGIYASWNWLLMVRVLSQTTALQRGGADIRIKLYGVYLGNDSAVMGLAKLLKRFKNVTISHLSLQVDDRSQERSFGSACLKRLQSYKHIKNVEIIAEGYESMFGLAAKLPTTILRLKRPCFLEGWNTPRSPKTLTFANLRSIELDCRDDPHAVHEILSFLQAPQLQTVYLEAMDTSGSAIILGAMFKSFLDRCTLLKNIKIGVIPGRDPWSSVQSRLEDLRLYVTNLGKRLSLEIDYWEAPDSDSLARSITGQAVPLSEPLQGHIEGLYYMFDEESRLPMYRATRVRLPSVRELLLQLMDGPRAIGILQWYLDGLDLPKLAKLTVTLGCGPDLFRVILGYLPLLPSCCSSLVLYSSTWTPIDVDAFEHSDGCKTLLATCLSLGMDLRFEGEYWSVPPQRPQIQDTLQALRTRRLFITSRLARIASHG